MDPGRVPDGDRRLDVALLADAVDGPGTLPPPGHLPDGDRPPVTRVRASGPRPRRRLPLPGQDGDRGWRSWRRARPAWWAGASSELLSAWQPVRALTRTPAAANLPGDVEVVTEGLREPGSLAPALDAVERMYLFPVGCAARGAVAAAKRARVRPIVVLSGATAGRRRARRRGT